MSEHTMTGSQRQWLERELAAWQAEGILDAAQSDRIRERYESGEDAGRRKQSVAAFALMGMAVFLIGLAVLLLIGFNWDAIPRAGKVALIFGTLAIAYGVGFWLRFRTRARLASELVLFFAALLYGGAIWLLAQVFHLDAHYPDGFLYWALGLLPLALCLDTLLVHALLALLLAVWAGTEVLGFIPRWFLHHATWLSGAYLLPLLVAPGILWAYRKGSPLTLGLYLAVGVWWVILLAFAWGAWGLGPVTFFWISALGALLLVVAEVHSTANPMSVPWRLFGVLIAAGCLLPMSYFGFGMAIGYARHSRPGSGLFAASGLAAVAGLAVVLALWRLRGCGSPWVGWRERLRELAFPLVLAAFMVGLGVWVMSLAPSREAHGYGLGWSPDLWLLWGVPALLANLAILGLAAWLVRVGVRDERLRPFAAGVLYFLLWAVVRYLDLFAHYGGILGASVMFALCGVGLFVVGMFYQRVRIRRTEAPSPQPTVAPSFAVVGVEAVAGWLQRNQVRVLIGTAVLQTVFLVGMMTVHLTPLLVGKTVLLRMRPVDPRDLMRGDYVILNYEASQARLDAPGGGVHGSLPPGTPVYVLLEPEADGKHWRPVRASLQRPAEGTYLAGRYAHRSIRFGIEAYYVQEGHGRELERAVRARHLSAEVAVAPWGQAALRRLIIE